MAATKLRWADVEDNDDSPFDLPLPLPIIEGPDENGFKRTIEYKLDDAGRKVKITTTTRIRKIASTHLSKRALERRSWAKFGDAVNDDPSSRLTVVSTDEIFLERPRAAGASEVVSPVIIGGPLEATAGLALMMCRVCKKRGDHWTARCPYKSLTQEETEAVVDQAPAKPGKYVPPKARPGSKPEQERKRREEYSVKVNNLSEDASNDDLYELFSCFGQVSRANVVFDKMTGASRGFGFVDFHRNEDAEKAIQRLNGFGYGNLILSVELAPPRAK